MAVIELVAPLLRVFKFGVLGVGGESEMAGLDCIELWVRTSARYINAIYSSWPKKKQKRPSRY